MGVCSSCLGGNRRPAQFDEEDEAQRLFDEHHGMHYGGVDQAHMNGAEDPMEVQREIEALQRVVARTSDNMIDIYEIVPQDKVMEESDSAPFAYSGQDARVLRYQNLLSKLSAQDDSSAVARVIDWGMPEDEEDEETIEMQYSTVLVPVKIEAGGEEAFVGNFADAAAAMR